MVAPISVSPQMNRGDSVLGAELKKVYGPYITAAYLDHSYKFFAPNPGASHLVRYDLYFADGTKRVNSDDQILPDRLGHWPRLLYHRHFMLTEFMNFPPIWQLGEPPGGQMPGTQRPGAQLPGGPFPGGPPPGALGAVGPGGNGPTPGVAMLGPVVQSRAAEQLGPVGPLALPEPATASEPPPAADLLERIHREPPPGTSPAGTVDFGPLPPVVAYWRATAAYLAKRHGAVRVDLYFREHRLPYVEEFRQTQRLDAPEWYAERLLVSYRVEGAK